MMAVFEIAFRNTIGHEGGYVNDPDDPGGETIFGISYRAHPDWGGWPVLHEFGAAHPDLLDRARDLYYQDYWRPIYGDDIIYQPHANELFDSAVNTGIQQAVRFCQRALNLMNRNGTKWMDIEVDGIMGPKTLGIMNATMMDDKDPIYVYNAMNLEQGWFYRRLMKDQPWREKYIGWFNRVKLLPLTDGG